MKCVCGYEHVAEYVRETKTCKSIIGDKEFLRIEGSFVVSKERDYGPDDLKKVTLYACPECGTIKMIKSW